MEAVIKKCKTLTSSMMPLTCHSFLKFNFLGIAETGPASGEGKVIKGGSWHLCECYTRPAHRESREITHRDHGLGFRLALDSKQAENSLSMLLTNFCYLPLFFS